LFPAEKREVIRRRINETRVNSGKKLKRKKDELEEKLEVENENIEVHFKPQPIV
jgi:hypothetical protein